MARRRKPGKPFQETEQRLLCQAIQEAVSWLNEGKYATGYRCLYDGLERAREWEASGEAWAKDMVADWQAALFEYADLYPASERMVMTPKPQLPPEWQDIFARRRSPA